MKLVINECTETAVSGQQNRTIQKSGNTRKQYHPI
ncbi:unnamed protein product [Gulo gulo]|uniref:Uncharacterized protein n=1 Tax=Gulo gulo TaxID=48420 RepID=A0A9X9M123_GULGU|nr:unnamed protein product [Gulo gulo]